MFIQTEDLVKAYKERNAVNGVSIRVDQGQIVGLLGPNGAGKTTTFYMMLETTKLSKKEQHEKVEALMEEFSITQLRDRLGIQLSGGERRRVEIARCLVMDPAFILLDEPFAGIDPLAVNDIQGIISHLKRRGMGVLITDHNVRETLSIVDKAYILSEGKILLEGSPEMIANDPVAKKFYLGEEFRM